MKKLTLVIITIFCSNLAAKQAPNQLPSIAPMIKKVMPSIVSISAIKKIATPQVDGNNPQRIEEQLSTTIGAGIIVDSKYGYILTNQHVVDKPDEIYVTLTSGPRYSAKLLGFDETSDLALLKIEAKNLQQIKFGDSDRVEVGDFVIAVGNPFGLSNTVTSGIISAIGRTNVLGVEGYYDFIQTDAQINVGNSGGPLLNYRGELIGINTASIAPNHGGSVGIGLAIPANLARGILTQLAHHGHVDRGPLGIKAQSVNSSLAEAFELSDPHGAIILDILPNTPAALANLMVGDVLLKFGDKKIKDVTHLRNLISLAPSKQPITLELLREKQRITTNITIISPRDNYTDGKLIFNGLRGVQLEPINFDEIKGVKIAEIHASRQNALELQENDLIIGANYKAVRTISDLKELAATGNILLLQIIRDKNMLFVAVN